ncbi:MAG: ribonuclease HI [Pyrinomonadaceae bacterium]
MRDEKKTRGDNSMKDEAEDLIHPSSLRPHPLKSVTIYCDGSSLGNGRAETRAAAVALLNFRDRWHAFGCYLGSATNQQAEIAAAAIGLEQLRVPCRVRILSDSRYVIETMSGRFRRKSNHEWWARLDKAIDTHRIEWEWIKGHAGHDAQEAVDRAARRIAALGHADESVLREAADALITL